jgi:acetoin utilization protein AcuB
MKIKELMSRDVVTIATTESCHDAVARMFRNRVRHLPVVGSDRRLVGIVTDRDLRHLLFTPEFSRALGQVPVEELLRQMRVDRVMSTPPITVGPDDDLEMAARTMLEDKVGSLPVVDGGQVIGIVTETDLLRRIVREDDCAKEVAEIVVSFP